MGTQISSSSHICEKGIFPISHQKGAASLDSDGVPVWEAAQQRPDRYLRGIDSVEPPNYIVNHLGASGQFFEDSLEAASVW